MFNAKKHRKMFPKMLKSKFRKSRLVKFRSSRPHLSGRPVFRTALGTDMTGPYKGRTFGR